MMAQHNRQLSLAEQSRPSIAIMIPPASCLQETIMIIIIGKRETPVQCNEHAVCCTQQ